VIEKMKALVREKDSCVLATVSGGRPHCSLMSYITDPECRDIFMVTLPHTKKYRNLQENPWVSLLIDTRDEGRDIALGQKKALTISGLYQKIDPTREREIRAQFLSRHPQLRELVEDPEAVMISIRVASFQLLEGVRDACFVKQD
jgi:nitroimidazol reductase NimA-like FMN-containing flavoprotein (pyridoxamine 5'-phosphate oxidase superfamily)